MFKCGPLSSVEGSQLENNFIKHKGGASQGDIFHWLNRNLCKYKLEVCIEFTCVWNLISQNYDSLCADFTCHGE